MLHYDSRKPHMWSIYGSEVEFSVNSRQYTALCLAHPRQTARLGKSNLYWFERHREWLAGNVKTEK